MADANTSANLQTGEEDISETTTRGKPDCDRRNVVVTGFGLFRNHPLNPSWEAIKDGQLEINRPDVNIITKQVSVTYEEVDRLVTALWRDYDPLLMVHVGLAAHESGIRIEQVARHGPYINDDVDNQAPHKDLRQYDDGEGEKELEENLIPRDYTCRPCEFDCSTTCLNVDRVCDKLNQAYQEGKIRLPVKKSTDAGLYVCEYIYQKSLKICDRSIFIHVPNVVKFPLQDIRTALQVAIEILIDEIVSYNS